MRYLLEVEVPGGVPIQFELGSERRCLGSGVDADMALANGPLLPQHLGVEATEMGAKLTTLTAERTFLSDGAEHTEALVAWGGEAFVEGVRLTFLTEQGERKSANPLLILALAAACVFVGWQSASPSVEASPMPAAPALTLPAAGCPAASAELAMKAAKRAEGMASSKEQRYPFDAAEGLKAEQALLVAEACYQLANDPEASAHVGQHRSVIHERLNADYASLRLRLESDVTQRHARSVRRSAARLDELLAPLGATPYRTWLAGLMRTGGAGS